LNAGALIPIEKLLYNTKKPVRKEVCWAVSNVTAGTST
jgi:hypothetical protein